MSRQAHEVMDGKPRIGLLGIMQELYDDMIPGITERQADYAAQVAQTPGAGGGGPLLAPGPQP